MERKGRANRKLSILVALLVMNLKELVQAADGPVGLAMLLKEGPKLVHQVNLLWNIFDLLCEL